MYNMYMYFTCGNPTAPFLEPPAAMGHPQPPPIQAIQTMPESTVQAMQPQGVCMFPCPSIKF